MSKRDEPMSPEARQALVDMFRRHNRVAQQCYRALRATRASAQPAPTT